MPTASAAIATVKRRLVEELTELGYSTSDHGFHRPSNARGISEFVSIEPVRFADKGSAGLWLIGGLAAVPAVHVDMPLRNRQTVAQVRLPQALRTSRTDDAWHVRGEQEKSEVASVAAAVLADLRTGLLHPLALVRDGRALADQIDREALPRPLSVVGAAHRLRARATLAALAGLPDAATHIDRYADSVQGDDHLLAYAEYLRLTAR